MLLRLLLLLIVAFGIFAGIVGCIQRRMVYFPRPYSESMLSTVPESVVRVPYSINGKSQVAFYVPPREEMPDGEPAQLWVLFHGNASIALWWLSWIEEDIASPTTGWLLVDYPGFGLNEGSPNRGNLVIATEMVIPALKSTVGDIPEEINTLGFSIGTAAAMEFAVRHPVKRVVLMAPFESLEAMARRNVGWPLSVLLLDRFDNAARLEQLTETSPEARVVIVHGEQDSVVPFSQGKALAERFPALVRFVPVADANHTDIFDRSAEIMRELLSDDSSAIQP